METLWSLVESAQNNDDLAMLKYFLQNLLTEREYFCIELIVFQGYSPTEVAHTLGITKQAVNQCKNRAFKKIKRNLPN